MSAIGNYIHYTAKGYEEHGITRKGTFQTWRNQRNEIIRKAAALRTSLTPSDREELEGVLNSLLRPAADDSMVAKARKEVEKIMIENFESSAKKINWDTGDIDWALKRSDTLSTLHRHRSEGRLKIDLEEMLNKVNKLIEIIDKKAKVESNGDALSLECKRLARLARQIKDRIDDDLKKDGWVYGLTNSKKILTDDQIIKYLNSLIETYAAHPAINLQKGTAFEAMIAMAPYVAQGMAAEEAAKQIKGSLTEEVIIEPSNFSSDYVSFNGFNNDYNIKTTGSISQGKVDVELTWNNKIAKISAKNVNLGNPYAQIHILSGSSLMFLIQDMDHDYVNHFLNLQVEHSVLKSKDEYQKVSKNYFGDKRKLIMQEMKLYLFYKALTGDNYKRKAADLFVINDNSKGEVYVYSIEDIINKIIYNERTLAQISVTNQEGINIMNLPLFKNDRVTGDATGQQRITSVLAQVHATKISASLRPSVLAHIW